MTKRFENDTATIRATVTIEFSTVVRDIQREQLELDLIIPKLKEKLNRGEAIAPTQKAVIEAYDRGGPKEVLLMAIRSTIRKATAEVLDVGTGAVKVAFHGEDSN